MNSHYLLYQDKSIHYSEMAEKYWIKAYKTNNPFKRASHKAMRDMYLALSDQYQAMAVRELYQKTKDKDYLKMEKIFKESAERREKKYVSFGL